MARRESGSKRECSGGAMITRAGSRTSVWMIPTDEDLMIARHAWTLLNQRAHLSIRIEQRELKSR